MWIFYRFCRTISWFSWGITCSLPTNCCVKVISTNYFKSILLVSASNFKLLLLAFGSCIWLILLAFLFCRFIEKLQLEIPGKGVKQLLEVLSYVYALSLLHKHQGDFLATGYLTPKQASLANDQLRTLYSKVSHQ